MPLTRTKTGSGLHETATETNKLSTFRLRQILFHCKDYYGPLISCAGFRGAIPGSWVIRVDSGWAVFWIPHAFLGCRASTGARAAKTMTFAAVAMRSRAAVFASNFNFLGIERWRCGAQRQGPSIVPKGVAQVCFFVGCPRED